MKHDVQKPLNMQNVKTITQTVVLKLPAQKYAHIFDIITYAFVVIWLSSNSQVQFLCTDPRISVGGLQILGWMLKATKYCQSGMLCVCSHKKSDELVGPQQS
jgi:hypothetical protein